MLKAMPRIVCLLVIENIDYVINNEIYYICKINSILLQTSSNNSGIIRNVFFNAFMNLEKKS